MPINYGNGYHDGQQQTLANMRNESAAPINCDDYAGEVNMFRNEMDFDCSDQKGEGDTSIRLEDGHGSEDAGI